MLLIQLTKNADSSVLTCTRTDGSISWQKQTRHAAHFVRHDLTHYAVETTLNYRQGFFGLIAAGWDIEDTTGKGTRGAVPPEAIEVEKIVGLFDSERGAGMLWTLEELNATSPRSLTTEEVEKIRNQRGALFQHWSALKSGDKLELQFEPKKLIASNA